MDNKQNKNNNKFYKNQGFYVTAILIICVVALTVAVVIRNRAEDQLADTKIERNVTSETEENTKKTDEKNLEEKDSETGVSEEEKTTDESEDKDEAIVVVETDETMNGESVAVSSEALKGFQRPVEGDISYSFRNGTIGILDKTDNINKTPRGVGIASELGTEVKSCKDGVVEYVGYEGPYGNIVVVKHEDDVKTVYGNLEDNILVKEGQKVKGGDVIGKIGESAAYFSKNGPHLHLEMINSNADYKTLMETYNENYDKWLNPIEYLN